MAIQPMSEPFWTVADIPSLDEAERIAIDHSRTGRDVEWTEVWEVPPSGHWQEGRKLRYYEYGERMNRRTGLPWVDDQTPET